MSTYNSTIKEVIGTYERFALGDKNMTANAIVQHSVCGINRNPVHRLFSRGELIAEIVEYADKPMKIWVTDYTITEDRSYGKFRVRRIEELVKCFLEKYGYPNCGYADHVKFMPRERVVEKTVEKIVEKPVEVIVEKELKPESAHWVKNCSPRNPDDVWYTCSACGKLAIADNNKDVLTDFCPHCGRPMHDVETVPSKIKPSVPEGKQYHRCATFGDKKIDLLLETNEHEDSSWIIRSASIDGIPTVITYRGTGKKSNAIFEIVGKSYGSFMRAKARGRKFTFTPIAEAA